MPVSELIRSRSVAIRSLIVAFAVILHIAIWGGIGTQRELARKEALAATVERNNAFALGMEAYVRRTLRTSETIFKVVDTAHERTGSVLSAPFLSGNMDSRIYHALHIVDQEGGVRTIYGPAAVDSAATRKLVNLHRRRSSTDPLLGVAGPALGGSRMVIPMSEAIRDRNGAFRGVLVAELQVSGLLGMFGRVPGPRSRVIALVGADGTLLAALRDGQLLAGLDLSASPVMAAQRRAPAGFVLAPSVVDGVERLYSYRTLAEHPGVVVVFSTSVVEALDPVARQSKTFYLVAGGFTIVTVAFVLLLLWLVGAAEKTGRQREAMLRRLSTAQELARVGDWYYDSSSGALELSPMMYRFLGMDPNGGAPRRRDLLSRLTRENRAKLRNAMAEAASSGDPRGFEVQASSGEGIQTFQIMVNAIRGEAGAVSSVYGTARDITEQQRLQELQDELAHLSRIGAMNALTATISHELTQPLTAANNYLSVGRKLISRLPEDPGGVLAETVGQAYQQVARATEIIRRMRNLVSKGKSEREVIDLDEIIDDVLLAVSVTRVCRAAVGVDRAADEILVYADAVQIQQVLLNLIRNACEAQKNMSVSPPLVRVRLVQSGQVCVSVVDHGPGVPEDLRRKLFLPFTSSKRSGLGLGLSISRTIIDAHGGTIKAENNPTGGACVSFTLPVHESRSRKSD